MFYVLWIIAESGRTVGPPWPAYPFTLAVLAASIGLARAFPGVAIMLPAAVLIFQLAFSPARFGSTTWPVYFGILIACFIVSATANKKTRLLALPVTVAYAVMCAMLMGIPTLSDGWGWSAWVGATYLVNPVQDSFLLLLAADLVLAVGTWSLAFGLRSSRLLQETDAKFGATVQEPSARITFDWRGPGLALSISSRGTLVPADGATDSGSRTTRGLYGMRERARLAGGWLTSGADDEGDVYLVTAFIPSTGDGELATGEPAETTLALQVPAAL